MKTIHIPNLPDEVYAQIEKLAKVRGTTPADVAANFITRALTGFDEAKLMEEIRADREAMAARGVWITDADIREARDWGRK
jgi:hypothetical protein